MPAFAALNLIVVSNPFTLADVSTVSFTPAGKAADEAVRWRASFTDTTLAAPASADIILSVKPNGVDRLTGSSKTSLLVIFPIIIADITLNKWIVLGMARFQNGVISFPAGTPDASATAARKSIVSIAQQAMSHATLTRAFTDGERFW